MPADWLFYWMTLPTGLAAIAAAVVLPFLLWRVVLGRSFPGIGYKPLGIAYAFAAAGLLILNFASAYSEFSSRVAKNILPEAQRWFTVPSWTIYITVLSLIIVLPLVGLFGVSISGLLLRYRRLSFVSIGAVLLLACLTLVLVAWAFPDNEWHSTHHLESLAMWFSELAPSVLLVGLPFFAGIYMASRKYRNAET